MLSLSTTLTLINRILIVCFYRYSLWNYSHYLTRLTSLLHMIVRTIGFTLPGEANMIAWRLLQAARSFYGI